MFWSSKYSLSTSSPVLHINLTSLCFDPVVTNLNVYRTKQIKLMSKAGIRWILVCTKESFQGAISWNIELTIILKMTAYNILIIRSISLRAVDLLIFNEKNLCLDIQLCQNSFQTFSVWNHSLDQSKASLDGLCLSYMVRWLNSDFFWSLECYLAEMGCV